MSQTPIDFLIIIPTFRRPEYLRAAINGAMEQPDVNKKIIVVDDSPEGSAAEVSKDFGGDVVYIRSPVPTGGWPGRVRNFGLHAAAEIGLEPSFVHFLDDDDIPLKGVYAKIKSAFDGRPDVGVVYGALLPFCIFSENPERQKLQETQLLKVKKWHAHITAVSKLYGKVDAISKPLAQWFYRQQYLFSHELFLCSGGVIRYRHVKDLNGFDQNIRITEDYEFYTRAIVRFGAYFLGQPIALYRVGSVDALWNPLALEGTAKDEHESEVGQTLKFRKARLKEEMGGVTYLSKKFVFRSILFLLKKTVVGRLEEAEVSGQS